MLKLPARLCYCMDNGHGPESVAELTVSHILPAVQDFKKYLKCFFFLDLFSSSEVTDTAFVKLTQKRKEEKERERLDICEMLVSHFSAVLGSGIFKFSAFIKYKKLSIERSKG